MSYLPPPFSPAGGASSSSYSANNSPSGSGGYGYIPPPTPTSASATPNGHTNSPSNAGDVYSTSSAAAAAAATKKKSSGWGKKLKRLKATTSQSFSSSSTPFSPIDSESQSFKLTVRIPINGQEERLLLAAAADAKVHEIQRHVCKEKSLSDANCYMVVTDTKSILPPDTTVERLPSRDISLCLSAISGEENLHYDEELAGELNTRKVTSSSGSFGSRLQKDYLLTEVSKTFEPIRQVSFQVNEKFILFNMDIDSTFGRYQILDHIDKITAIDMGKYVSSNCGVDGINHIFLLKTRQGVFLLKAPSEKQKRACINVIQFYSRQKDIPTDSSKGKCISSADDWLKTCGAPSEFEYQIKLYQNKLNEQTQRMHHLSSKIFDVQVQMGQLMEKMNVELDQNKGRYEIIANQNLKWKKSQKNYPNQKIR